MSMSEMVLSDSAAMFESNDVFKNDELVILSNSKSATAADDMLKAGVEDTPFTIHSSVMDSVFSTDNDEFLQDQTPMFDELDFIVDGSHANLKDDWVSLFNESDVTHMDPIPEVESVDSVSVSLVVAVPAPAPVYSSKKRSFAELSQNQLFTPNTNSTLPTPVLSDTKTFVAPSPTLKNAKVDHLGCVKYSKKQRVQPLEPVKMDDSDPTLMKRARNTEAARRSRARKMERMGQLEMKVQELLTDNKDMESEVLRLKELLNANGIAH